MTDRLRLFAEDGVLALALGPGWRRTTPAIVGLAALVLLNIGVGAFVTAPLWRAAAAEGAVERTALRAQEALEPSLVRARAEYGRVLEAEAALALLHDQIAARSGSVSEVVSTLRAAIDGSGLRADRINYQSGPVEELGLTRLQIDLPVRGSYAQLRAFLDTLLTGPIFAIVERVGATTPSSSDRAGGLQLNLAISVFLAGGLTAGDEGLPPFLASGEIDEVTAESVAGRDPVAFARQLRARLAALPASPLQDAAFELGLARLEVPTLVHADTDRNLFDFAFVERVASPPRERERQRERDVTPPAPVMPYDLLGIIRTRDGLMATISDGRDVLNVRAGDRLKAGMRIKEITLVDVTLEAGRRETVLSLRKSEDVSATGRREKKSDGGSREPRR